jgi:hypothetical protein
MAISTPKPRNISDIKSSLLQPATTSHYELFLSIPDPVSSMMKTNGIIFSGIQNDLQLACCEATLPGSSLATLEINNDYTGVTERHAYRRIYDDRIDLTFYVDTRYTAIRFFETWIKFIVSESISGGPNNEPLGLKSPNYFYTVRYPEEYQTQNLSIVKFEKDYTTKLTYTFLKAYPISISSMPISYDSSSLLKCTVSFSYTRYFVEDLNGSPPSANSENPQASLNNPLEQAGFNLNAYQTLVNPEFGVDTTGGLSIQNALSSGNSIQSFEGDEIIGAINSNSRFVESGLPYVGRNIGPLAR